MYGFSANVIGGTIGKMQITLGGSGNSNSTDVIMSNVLVPAPGAVALLGMAGLVGSRRRR